MLFQFFMLFQPIPLPNSLLSVCVHSCVGTFTVTLATKLLSPSGCGGILPLQARQCHRQRHVTTYLNDLPLLHSRNRLTSTIYLYFIFTQPTYLNDLPLLHSCNQLTSTIYFYFIFTQPTYLNDLPLGLYFIFTQTDLPQRLTSTSLAQPTYLNSVPLLHSCD